jgi:hypothetical protein
MGAERGPREAAAWLKSKLKATARLGARKRFGVPDSAIRNFESFMSLSGSAASSLPTELMALGADMWSGFMLTPFAEQQMDGWVLPYWLVRQRTPSSGSFIPHGHFWLECNMTHRNWTGIGLCGFPNEAIVDPRGLLTPWPFSPSVDVWVMAGKELVCPSELEDVSQSLVGGVPIVRTSFEALGIECVLTTFVARVDTVPVALCLCEATNAACEAERASLVVSVRPYNPETICAINELIYDTRARTFTGDGNLLAYLGIEPASVLLSDYKHGDVAEQLRDPSRERLPEGSLSVNEPFGLSTGAALFDLDLSQGATSQVCFASALSPAVHPALGQALPPSKSVAVVEDKLSEQEREWRALTSEGMTVRVPDADYQKAFDVNKAYLLLLFDGRSITPGVSTYHMMWFRDAAYLVPALERLGHVDKARDILGSYTDRQTPDGYFRSHSGEWDSNGQAMYTLVHHYRITNDTSFINDVYPSLMKGARWLDGHRQVDLAAGDPRRGLLPAGISAEHFGMGDVYYWDDFWAVGGLRAVAGVAQDIGFTGDAAYLERVASEYMEALEASWAAVEKRLGRRVMPIAPDRDIDSASVGVVAAVYPLGIMSPDEEIMSNTLRELIDKCFYRDVLYHGILHCGLNAYLSLQVGQCLMKNRDPYALTIFDSLVSMATPTWTFPEAINPLTGGGAYGDGHHGWAVCEFLNFLRNMLLVEEGDRLALLKLSKPEWFAPGNVIGVDKAATFFGEVSYSVECADDTVTFNLPGAFERPPAAIELNVPFDIASCEADGQRVETAPGTRNLEVSPGTEKVVIKPAR